MRLTDFDGTRKLSTLCLQTKPGNQIVADTCTWIISVTCQEMFVATEVWLQLFTKFAQLKKCKHFINFQYNSKYQCQMWNCKTNISPSILRVKGNQKIKMNLYSVMAQHKTTRSRQVRVFEIHNCVIIKSQSQNLS